MKDEIDGENDADRGTTKSGAVGLLREERANGERVGKNDGNSGFAASRHGPIRK